MSSTAKQKPAQTRIQRRNRQTILDAALDVFSQNGFRGATLDEIAKAASLSKQNVIYYFGSKEAIHDALLNRQLDVWLDPLRDLDPTGDPIDEIEKYVRRKLDMSRRLPRESRLFANEIVQGAPHLIDKIQGPLRELVDEKARVVSHWAALGQIAEMDGHHLIFSIWATTQHYADFEVQVRGILRPEGDQHFAEAAAFLAEFYRRALTPD